MKETTQPLLTRVREASRSIFASTPLGLRVEELCDDHADACAAVQGDRSGGMIVVAVVGGTGQGKSWLIRQLIHASPARVLIRSGNDLDEATEQLHWIGPRPPADLDTRHETFIACDADHMQSIGSPYLLVDVPGATDDRRKIAVVATRGLSLASLLVMVVRRDQIRSQTVSSLTQASEGAVIIPVINAVRTVDASLDTDADAFVSRMRSAAPQSVIMTPVIIPDFDVESRDESVVGKAAAAEVAGRLRQAILENGQADRRRSVRIAALESRFRAALHSLLHDSLPGLSAAVESLHRETRSLPGDVAAELLGQEISLRATVRSRLRLELMENTSPLCFPFRTMLGLLNLTNGAWDRLFLSLSGSLPSLVGTLWTGARNVADGRDAAADLRDGLTRRSNAAINDRLRPAANRFRDELETFRRMAPAPPRANDDQSDQAVATLSGINALQESSTAIIDGAVERFAVSRLVAVLWGLIGTVIFWGLMAGPIVALYQGYVRASVGSLRYFETSLEKFPKPDAAMVLTSVLLSWLPMAIFAMITMSIAQSRRRVRLTQDAIRHDHEQAILRLQRDGVLRLVWNDPVLADAEFLLSIGGDPSRT